MTQESSMIMIIKMDCHSSTVIILGVSRAGIITVTIAEWRALTAQFYFGMTYMYINEPVSRIHYNNAIQVSRQGYILTRESCSFTLHAQLSVPLSSNLYRMISCKFAVSIVMKLNLTKSHKISQNLTKNSHVT